MKQSEQLSEFVRLSYLEGKTSEPVRDALASAGWSGPEIEEALSGWVPGSPPVPRPRPYASAGEALLYGLLFLSLGVISWHLCQLGMGIIDYLVPDESVYPVTPGGSERWSIAALIVFTPVFLLLHRRVSRVGQGGDGRRKSLVRKWFASMTLLMASLVLLGDAMHVIYSLLNGDVAIRFLCKAILVALIAGLVLGYYRDEANG
ncbi:DUF5671 domain-containing protein [Paracoccus litorisediminis]|uniref:DUF5671 domain-containing protein n=1 Tax=Paracoccus litorisediminis TaxID=2006130 RepID=UPI0037318C3D